MQNPTGFFFDLRIRRPKSSDFGPKSDDLGQQVLKSKDGMLSKFKMLSTTANSSRTTDELDGDSCITTLLARRAVGASLRGQTTVGWRGLGPRDQEKRPWRAPLRKYVTRRLHCRTAATATAVSHIVKRKIPRQVDSSALGTSLRRQTTVSLGSDAWVLRAVQRTQRVSSRCQTTTTAVGLSVCSNLCTHNKSDFSAYKKTVSICQVHI